MQKRHLLLILLMAFFAPLAMNAQNQLNEGFESTTFPPTDWETIHVSGANSWARNTTYHHTGSACTYAHWASAGHENYLITPKLAPATGETLSFYVAAQSYSGTTLKVELSTSGYAASNFTTTLATYTTGSGGTIGTTSPSTWVQKEINLSGYAGQNIYIAFHVIDNNGGDVLIDDVTGVSVYVPSCPRPTMNPAENVDEDGASLSWEENGSATQWLLQYSTDEDFTTYTERNRNGIPSLAITDLTPGTTYYARVKSICGGDDASDWSNVITFRTKCTPITTLPWSENFESFAANTTTSYSATYKLDDPCWVNEHISGNGTYLFQVTSYTQSGNSTKKLQLPDMSSGTMTKLVLPGITLPAGNNYQFVLDVLRNASGTSYTEEGIRVYASTDGEIEGATELAFISRNCTVSDGNLIPAENTTGWYNYELPIPFTGTCYIILRGESKYGSATYMDNFVVEETSSCLKPTALAVTASGQSATFTWNSDATQWAVAHSTDITADPSDNVVTTVSEATYTMNNLALDQDHYFWVRSNCSATQQSSWVGPVSVHIGYCVPAPSSVDYNGITSLTFGTGDYVVNNNSNHPTSAPYYADFSSQIGGVEAGVESQIVITYSTGSYDYQTYVWVDFDNSLTFDNDEIICSGSSNTTLTLTFTVPATTAAGDYRMRIGGADSGMDYGSDPCYTGTYGIFEDYTLRVISVACPAPTNLTASNVMPTSATLNWDGEAEGYNVRYRKAAHTETLFSEGFENGIPSTWTTIDSDGDGNNWMAISEVSSVYTSYSGTLSDWAHSESNAATSPSYANGEGCFDSDQWLISPQVPLQGTLRFYAASTYSDLDAYEVLLSTTGTATTDFTTTLQAMKNAPYALNDGTDDWEEVTIDLSSYSGQGYIAIHHVSSCMYFLVVDDFEIYEEVGENWTPATAENGATSKDIDGLDPEYEYEWQVQADCDTDGLSSWSAIATFTTPSACTTPSELSATVTGNAAALSWSGYADTYDIHYREVDPTAPATLILNVPTDIWNDGTGYQLILDADHNTYGSTIPETGNFTAGTFANFEYTIPENAVCDASTNTIVVNGSATITIPAGVYDYVFLNPDPSSGTYYIAASQDGFFPSRGDDFEFVSGQTYEFTLSLNGSNDAITATITDNGNAWTLVEDVTSPYTLENLNPTTTYEWQVQGVDCDGNGNNTDWSASATFTTPEFYTKHITGYGDDETVKTGWYLIASPLAANTNPANVTHLINTAGYDLYSFNQAQELEWVNFKPFSNGAGQFNLENGKGYLYANKETDTLVFTGAAYSGDTKDVTLTYSEANSDTRMYGMNLVGNPFPESVAYIDRDFYTIHPSNSEFVATSGAIEPMEGAIVQAADANDNTLTFSKTPSKSSRSLSLNLTQGRGGLIDRAIVHFDESKPLSKLQLRDNSTSICVTMDGMDYASIAAENQGEMPVSFKAEENGTYTLSFNSENVSFGYLHLIDNMTGADIDLLANPSYTFEAKKTDYRSRFKLVFATGNADDDFAFCSNGNWVINNEGNATLQVIDVNGRIIRSESINGCANVNLNVANGVYMIRLINGSNVKTQKVVVR